MFYEPKKNDHGLAKAPFKSCAVPRCIGWISTISPDGVANIAPYSQFTNLSFDPPYVLVACNQNLLGERKDTTRNIEATGEFVYNLVSYELIDKMNITASRFFYGIDEFERAGLTKAESVMVKPYRVAESPVQLECKYHSTIRLPGNGKVGTVDCIIGEVVGVHVKDEVIMADGKIDMEKIKPVARMGYNDYTVVEKVFELLGVPQEDEIPLPNALKGNQGLEGAAGAVK